MRPSPIYTAHNIAEARQYSLEGISLTLKERIFKIIICLELVITNSILSLMRIILFKWGYPHRVKDIVVFTSGILGDTIIMAGAIASLKEHFKKAKVTVITNCQHYAKEGSEILSLMPYVDRQIFVEDNYIYRKGYRFNINNEQLKGITSDLFVNLSPFGRRGWTGAVVREMILARLLKARWAIGFSVTSPLPGPKTKKIIQYFCINESRRSAFILRKLKLVPLTGELAIPVNPEKQREISTLLDSTGIPSGKSFAVINPGAKNNSKCWSPLKFGEVAKWLFEVYGMIPILTGSANESERCELVNKASGSICINLAGKTDLAPLIELLRLATLCISNDTGPMHISGCLGKSTVGIFTMRWNIEFWFPQGEKSVGVFSKPSCSLCIRDPFLEDEDPIICLEDIDIGSVKKAIAELIPDLQDPALNFVS